MALTPQTRTSQSVVRTITQYPAEFARVTEGGARVAAKAEPFTRISEARVRAVVRGRVFDPRVRAWTFTLDGHDFYVIRLGERETLVYDLATKEWSTWGSASSRIWEAYIGTNWIGGRLLGAQYGSDVVVGSDRSGALYFLAPEEVDDDDPVEGAALPRPFLREATGQFAIASGYDYIPCFGVQVAGSIGYGGGAVELEVSDDRGENYVSVGELTTADGDHDFRLAWLSLGQMRQPGRLFKLTDYGALQRIDGFEMEVQDAS